MGKVENNRYGTTDIINKIPVLGSVWGLVIIAIKIFLSFSDPHAVYSARYKSVRNTIEHDLKKANLDPKTKEELKKNLKLIDEKAYEYFKSDDSGYASEMIKAYNRFLLDSFPAFGDFLRGGLLDPSANDDIIDKNIEDIKSDPFSKMNLK